MQERELAGKLAFFESPQHKNDRNMSSHPAHGRIPVANNGCFTCLTYDPALYRNRPPVREFQPLAEQGHAEAQYILGVMYSRGLGVPKDDREAVSWIRLAAEQGLAGAQVNLGIRYSTGDGVPKDYVQAYAWLNLAGAQGAGSARVIRVATCIYNRFDLQSSAIFGPN